MVTEPRFFEPAEQPFWFMQFRKDLLTAFRSLPDYISDATITLGQIQDITADRILGRITTDGVATELTAAQVRTLLNVEDGASADMTGAEIKTAYEADADTNAFNDAAVTKLAGIEAGADVTDTANVTAAGALMDSEVDADIKTLALPANTTISAFGATVIDDADAGAVRTTIGAVGLTGNESVAGIKTFTDNPVVSGTGPRYNLSETDTSATSQLLLAGSVLYVQGDATGLDVRFTGNTAATSLTSFRVRWNGGWNYIASSSSTTGGTGSAGAGKQYVELDINGTIYKVLHDGTV